MSAHRLFGKALRDLSLEDLEAFLSDAGEEGVLWEAKADGTAEGTGGGRLRPQHVERPVCGFANQLGGCLLIGVKQNGDEWEIVGVEPPDTEFGRWLDRAIARVQPAPKTNQIWWRLADGRVTAVIEVHPAAETPCMTHEGVVYERTSSDTVRVSDPVRLNALIDRGRDRRSTAENHAAQAASVWLNEAFADRDHCAWVIGSLSAINYAPDISSRLFTQTFKDELLARFHHRLYAELQSSHYCRGTQTSVRQNHVQVAAGTSGHVWAVRVYWDGTATAIAALDHETAGVNHMQHVIRPARCLLAELVELVGGAGTCHHLVKIAARPEAPGVHAMAPTQLPSNHLFSKFPQRRAEVQRWTLLGEPSKDELQSISRELLRVAEYKAFEDDADGGENYCY